MKRICSYLVMATTICAIARAASAQQPFSNVQQQPTVSPYLNLLNRQGQGLPNYQTLVRPYVRSEQEFARQQNQIQRLQRQQGSLAAGAGLTGARGVSTQIRGTGHVTRFMDTSHYFPQRQ
jgi:hypothetical protein